MKLRSVQQGPVTQGSPTISVPRTGSGGASTVSAVVGKWFCAHNLHPVHAQMKLCTLACQFGSQIPTGHGPVGGCSPGVGNPFCKYLKVFFGTEEERLVNYFLAFSSIQFYIYFDTCRTVSLNRNWYTIKPKICKYNCIKII